MLPSQILKIHIEDILKIFKQYPKLTNLSIFGSVARGDDTEKSDIDFLVDALPGTTLFDLGGAQYELEKLFKRSVDLVTTDELHPEFKNAIMNEAKPIRFFEGGNMYFTSWSPQIAKPCSEIEPALKRIQEMKILLDQRGSLSPTASSKLMEKLLVDFTYHSNSIEGNSLTLSETQVVLLYGNSIGGKPFKDHLEAINHGRAFELILEKGKDKRNITLEDIRSIHALVLAGHPEAGQWRQAGVFISGSNHIPPRPEKINYCMAEFMSWIENESHDLNPIERAARLHADLATIHPFIDGNGRTARLVMSLELLKIGLPVTIIKVEERNEYIHALETIQQKADYRPFLAFICRVVERSFDPYWYVLDVPKETVKEAISSSPISDNDKVLIEKYRLGEISYAQLRNSSPVTDPQIWNFLRENGFNGLHKMHPDDIEADAEAFVKFLKSLSG